MSPNRHGGATTTHAVPGPLQRSQASLSALSQKSGINPKTVAEASDCRRAESRSQRSALNGSFRNGQSDDHSVSAPYIASAG